jgi:hypothetical protein
MKKTSEIETFTEVINDIICNRCGGSCKCEMNFNGLLETCVVGAYDSTHLVDMRKYVFSLCEKCLSELFDSFLIKPEFSE